ncbi:hypothetical protein [Streptomyces sp. NPDC049040]|uniref:hypothetical protein n=1 Tax=Streptomyces sp. NPDC049040 TaxID=3365593 RepID=UPI00371BDBC7
MANGTPGAPPPGNGGPDDAPTSYYFSAAGSWQPHGPEHPAVPPATGVQGPAPATYSTYTNATADAPAWSPPQAWGTAPHPPGWGAGGPYAPQARGPAGPYPPQTRGVGAPYPPPAWAMGAPPRPPRAPGDWPSVAELWAQTPGCLAVGLLLLPPTIPLLLLYAMARSARHHARAVFAGLHSPLADPALSRAKTTRTVLAALASTAFLLLFGARKDYAEAFEGGAVRLMIAPWLLAVTAPLVVHLLMRWASVDERRRMRASFRIPLAALGKYVVGLTAVPLLALLAYVTPKWPGWSSFHAVALKVALGASLAWAVTFTLFASSLVVRSGFGIGRIHQALPALLTALLVWEFVPVAAVLSGLPPGPLVLSLLSMFSGPLSVTAVAWWEVHLLTTRHGVVLRA